ncbi:MAG: UPF0182 family protein [Chloroflexi bacterium]|nr:UPF0182 family protein [Chloroflexota bacterium]
MGFFDDRDDRGDRGDLGPPPEPFRIGGSGFRSPVPLRWLAVAAAAVVLFVVASWAKSIYVDFLWFESVEYEGNFRRVLTARIVLLLIGIVVSGLVLGFNVWLARRLAPQGIEESFIEDVDATAIRRVVTVALAALTIFLAIIFGGVLAGSWETILIWLNAVDFGVEEPAFGRDVSFYLFTLPAYHLIQGWVLSLLVISTLGAGAVYGLTFSLQRFEVRMTRGMRIHLSLLGGLILLVIAYGSYLGVFDLVTSPGGIVTGATFTDINARLPARYALVALGAFAGLVTIANSVLGSGWRAPAFAVSLWVIAGIVGGLIYPSFVQSFQVDPNELEKEERFIARNIEGTRHAWGLDEIVETTFPAEPAVTEEEIAANQATLDNVRLLDPRPMRDTFNQIQSIRPLYQFEDIDVDRYTIDDQLRQVMLAPRELDLRRATQTGGSGWTQQRLQFTHGFGAVVARVNEITTEGLPVLLTRDIPPVGEEVPITEDGARIYFGELTNHYVIVNTNEPEFDYPEGDTTVETRYEPDRGIALSNILRRFALAWELGDRNVLISGQLSGDSRLLMHRSLGDRIRKVAPFLELDSDPYVIVIDGELTWIQDAYTTSGSYPYSQHIGSINYLRNSVKVVVDAQTGDMTFYLIDEADPVVQTWAKIFPDMFTPVSEMPQTLRQHLRYPEDLFRLQAEQYLRYHIQDPRTFFIGEDLWAVPTEKFRQQEQPLEPYYVIMKLPGEEAEEFSLILPFTPRNKQNTIAWLAGRSDGDNLGKLRAYRFPTDDLVFGPAQIEARIDQDPGISAQLTLWEGAGSEVIRGNLLMIPLGESFLFIEPIYLQADSSRIPELRRVVVANGNNIAMEPTFERALDVVFGRRASSLPGSDGTIAPQPSAGDDDRDTAAPVAPTGDFGELLRQAQEAADAAQTELDRLRAILEQLEQSEVQ